MKWQACDMRGLTPALSANARKIHSVGICQGTRRGCYSPSDGGILNVGGRASPRRRAGGAPSAASPGEARVDGPCLCARLLEWATLNLESLLRKSEREQKMTRRRGARETRAGRVLMAVLANAPRTRSSSSDSVVASLAPARDGTTPCVECMCRLSSDPSSPTSSWTLVLASNTPPSVTPPSPHRPSAHSDTPSSLAPPRFRFRSVSSVAAHPPLPTPRGMAARDTSHFRRSVTLRVPSQTGVRHTNVAAALQGGGCAELDTTVNARVVAWAGYT
jgi:hypothetical protein